MSSSLDERIQRIHASLGSMESKDISAIKPEITISSMGYYTKVDFNQNANEAEMKNIVYALIANTASIKDHFKVWCHTNNVPFHGETLINSSQSVAIIHDLWNIDKHAQLNNQPRSGRSPKLRNIQKMLSISAGTSANSSAFYTMDPRTGKVQTESSGDGSVTIRITAEVVDEAGNILGDFLEICTQAINEWSNLLTRSGVIIP